MSKLQDFLAETPVNNLTEQIIVSSRLKDMPFTIRAMTGKEFTEYTKFATDFKKGKKVDFDTRSFNERVIICHTVEPNFKDAEFIKKAGCETPEQLLHKVLLAGEQAELSAQINKLSGFDSDIEELVEEGKNS